LTHLKMDYVPNDIHTGLKWYPSESIYNKEAVTNLVNQLIKLQQEYNDHRGNVNFSSKSEIEKAMKTINKALKQATFVDDED